MQFERGSGILLHPTSFPSDFAIGDFGTGAFRFVDFLVEAAVAHWQILPLSPPGEGNSPYSAYSAFAIDPIYISPSKLVEANLISGDALANSPPYSNRVDFDAVRGWKDGLMRKAFYTFRMESFPEIRHEFEAFCGEHSWWLDDYALFRALKSANGERGWFDWEPGLKLRQPDAVAKARQDLSDDIDREKFAQFLAFSQWSDLKEYANAKGIAIIGDIPIFVALDSADVWCNRDEFKLNDDGSPRVVSGVPPDYFSPTGQKWGNPIYDWEAMRSKGFGWWTARIAHTLRLVDAVRLDHFIGFVRNWEIPAGDDTAVNGQWVDVPGHAFFSTLRHRLGDIAAFAEDLGEVTEAVSQLRDVFEIPGMRVLQFAFGGDAGNLHLPHNYIQNSLAYTGTHDNATTVEWWKGLDKHARAHAKNYLKTAGRDIHWEMIRAVLASVADTVIIPMQDILGLGAEARMNTPSVGHGNWGWRMSNDAITEVLAGRLREMLTLYGRKRG
ncbi:MAG: 4-alpha-glucanotransferase [Blastocatellia bacterium]|nr:4-alpha-glucanotransferase [Blastocatellia bacterium]